MARRMTRMQQKAMFARLNTLDLRSNRLPVQVAVVVPSTTRNDKKISPSSFTKRVDSEKRFFDKTYGGDTTVKAVGSFVLVKGKKELLIKEKTAIVESSTTPRVFNAKRKVLIRHIKDRKKEWKQNSIFYKIEGESFNFPRRKFIAHDNSRRKILVT